MKNIWLVCFILNAFIVKAQNISTFAGNGSPLDTGDGNIATLAGLNRPYGVVFDKSGNLYTVQPNTHRVRKIASDGIVNTIAGNGIASFSGDGALAMNSQVNSPRWVAIDKNDNIYIADGNNYRVRKIDAITGLISTIAGNGTSGYNGDNIPATTASLILPSGICVDTTGNIYIADGPRIRKVDISGVITTVVGTGISGFSGDGGLATAAQINASRVYVDDLGNLTIVDFCRVRRVDAATNIINTIAGTGLGLYNGDEIDALSANMNVVALAWDTANKMYVADLSNDRIRMIDEMNIIHTVAGTGTAGFSGDGGLATLAEMYDPTGVAFDSCSNLYIPCKENHRIRKVTYNPNCTEASVLLINGSSFSIYPNPTSSQLTIAGDNIASITITNTLGQIVYLQKVSAEKTVVDVNALHAGVYFVTLTDTHGAKVTKKVAKE